MLLNEQLLGASAAVCQAGDTEFIRSAACFLLKARRIMCSSAALSMPIEHVSKTACSSEIQRQRESVAGEKLQRAGGVAGSVSDDDNLGCVAAAIDQVREHEVERC
jgi:hypothetical protein